MAGDGVTITEHPAGIEALMTGPIAKFVQIKTEAILAAAVAGVRHDTGQLAASLGSEMKVTGKKVEGLVGVRTDANQRSGGDTATNVELLRFDEFGTGHEPANHGASQALNAART